MACVLRSVHRQSFELIHLAVYFQDDQIKKRVLAMVSGNAWLGDVQSSVMACVQQPLPRWGIGRASGWGKYFCCVC